MVSSDEKLQDYYQSVRSKKNFMATHDKYAYSVADVIIVDINLDVQKNSNDDGQKVGLTLIFKITKML